MENQEKEVSKYYWLRLGRGFFKRHDMTIIERAGGYPDGLLMGYFYIKLLAESIDHEGYLRFSDDKPYNNMMLSALTGVDIRIVDKGMEVMKDWGIINILEDGTIHMVNAQKMFGVGSSTNRVRAYRERKNSVQSQTNETVETVDENEVEEKRVEEEQPKKKRMVFVKPTIDDVRDYIEVNPKYQGIVDPETFWNFYESKNWYVGKNKMSNWHSAVATFSKNKKNDGKQTFEKVTPQQVKDNRKNDIFERTLGKK